MSDENPLSDALQRVLKIKSKNRPFRKPENLTPAIASELYKAFERLEADEQLLAAVGSWGDTATDEEFLQYLRDWNATGKVMQERQ